MTSGSRDKSNQPFARILVVDDSEGNRELLGTLLEEQSFAIEKACSVDEARRLISTTAEPFDLILSDVNMPGESGFDLIKWAKHQGSAIADLPILFITSELPEPEHRIHGLALGAADYVSRSLELDELVLRVTNAVENYRKVKFLKHSLEDSEKKALAGRLLAASNHEIKNLAQLVKISSEQLQRVLQNSPAQKDQVTLRSLAAMMTSSSMLVDISRNIGSLLSARAPDSVPVQVGPLLDDVTSMLTSRAKPASITHDITHCEGGCWCLGHKTSIKQVLVNLVLNSIESIEEMNPAAGGSIHIFVKCDPTHCHLHVTDNGIGFNRKETRSTFEAFASTKHLRGGQGLGLWLCSRLAESMGGKLTLSSDGPGTGARAELIMRSAKEPAATEKIDLSKYLVD